MVTFDDMQLQEKVKVYDKGVERQPGEPAAYASYAELLTLRDGDILAPAISSQEPLALECKEFLRAIVTGVPPKTDGQDGLRVLRVLEAAQEKLIEGRLAYQGAL